MARSFAYADIPTFKYQTFDYKSVQFTNIPLATRKKIEKEDGEANAEGVGDDKISEAAGEAAPEPRPPADEVVGDVADVADDPGDDEAIVAASNAEVDHAVPSSDSICEGADDTITSEEAGGVLLKDESASTANQSDGEAAVDNTQINEGPVALDTSTRAANDSEGDEADNAIPEKPDTEATTGAPDSSPVDEPNSCSTSEQAGTEVPPSVCSEAEGATEEAAPADASPIEPAPETLDESPTDNVATAVSSNAGIEGRENGTGDNSSTKKPKTKGKKVTLATPPTTSPSMKPSTKSPKQSKTKPTKGKGKSKAERKKAKVAKPEPALSGQHDESGLSGAPADTSKPASASSSESNSLPRERAQSEHEQTPRPGGSEPELQQSEDSLRPEEPGHAQDDQPTPVSDALPPSKECDEDAAESALGAQLAQCLSSEFSNSSPASSEGLCNMQPEPEPEPEPESGGLSVPATEVIDIKTSSVPEESIENTLSMKDNQDGPNASPVAGSATDDNETNPEKVAHKMTDVLQLNHAGNILECDAQSSSTSSPSEADTSNEDDYSINDTIPTTDTECGNGSSDKHDIPRKGTAEQQPSQDVSREEANDNIVDAHSNGTSAAEDSSVSPSEQKAREAEDSAVENQDLNACSSTNESIETTTAGSEPQRVEEPSNTFTDSMQNAKTSTNESCDTSKLPIDTKDAETQGSGDGMAVPAVEIIHLAGDSLSGTPTTALAPPSEALESSSSLSNQVTEATSDRHTTSDDPAETLATGDKGPKDREQIETETTVSNILEGRTSDEGEPSKDRLDHGEQEIVSRNFPEMPEDRIEKEESMPSGESFTTEDRPAADADEHVPPLVFVVATPTEDSDDPIIERDFSDAAHVSTHLDVVAEGHVSELPSPKFDTGESTNRSTQADDTLTTGHYSQSVGDTGQDETARAGVASDDAKSQYLSPEELAESAAVESGDTAALQPVAVPNEPQDPVTSQNAEAETGSDALKLFNIAAPDSSSSQVQSHTDGLPREIEKTADAAGSNGEAPDTALQATNAEQEKVAPDTGANDETANSKCNEDSALNNEDTKPERDVPTEGTEAAGGRDEVIHETMNNEVLGQETDLVAPVDLSFEKEPHDLPPSTVEHSEVPLPSPTSEKRRKHRHRAGWERERRDSKSSSTKSSDVIAAKSGIDHRHSGRRSTSQKITGTERPNSIRSSTMNSFEGDVRSKSHRSSAKKNTDIELPVSAAGRRDSAHMDKHTTKNTSRPKLFDGRRAESDTRFSIWGSSRALEQKPHEQYRRSRHEQRKKYEDEEARRARRKGRKEIDTLRMNSGSQQVPEGVNAENDEDTARVFRKEQRRKEKQLERADSEEVEQSRRRRGARKRATEARKDSGHKEDDGTKARAGRVTRPTAPGEVDDHRHRRRQVVEVPKNSIKNKAIESLKRIFAY